ncbi:MAG: DEAD/DEAH box helicase [Planctomycetia bacterium]|nr:DEAD/DEAH box helicase [Planctomycetia bacterium]
MMSRDELAEKYLETIPYALYPVQEDALLAWFSSEQGVLVCAPTGTGKTLIAEAAVFEALQTGKRMYYTTPLIALTDQKFRELQDKAESWGFPREEVGLVTGNHRVNPQAKVLVVVAEILFNRLLHPEQFDFDSVQSVVMDEFHHFNDPERGIVWEFTLALLPPHIRLLLLSATVGNAPQFANWLEFEHGRKVELVQSDERKVPLVFQWVEDKTLTEQIQWMCLGNEEERCTPALVFCFNREICWSVAEEIKGKELVSGETRAKLLVEINQHDWSQGAGPKLKQLLLRGVGVHHAGILPRYRHLVEHLFQQKLLAIATCTETLSAGINLPARSVVLPSLMKGPAGKQTMLDSGTAHQIFGRAGRPQFDTRGHVFVLAHEDDVKILRWQEKFNKLPADSKDPKILAEKKSLKKKQPKRNPNLQYWNESQFNKLKNAPAGNLESHGQIPWRMLAYTLEQSSDVELLRKLVQKRLLFGKKRENALKDLERMLATLWSAGYLRLEPQPPEEWFPKIRRPGTAAPLSLPEIPLPPVAEKLAEKPTEKEEKKPPQSVFGAGIFEDDEPLPEENPPALATFGAGILEEILPSQPEPVSEPPAAVKVENLSEKLSEKIPEKPAETEKPYVFVNGIAVLRSELESKEEAKPEYLPQRAIPLPPLERMAQMRSVHPIYADFLMPLLLRADREERLQAWESLLELPSSLGPAVRVPFQSDLPRGRLAVGFLDEKLLELGLALPEELVEQTPEERRKRRDALLEPIYTIPFAEKLFRLFQHEYPLVSDARIWPVWCAGELLKFNGKFNAYITAKGLQKQEGMIFRHALRLILLLEEFLPLDSQPQWQDDLREIIEILTKTCESADPSGTRLWLEKVANE